MKKITLLLFVIFSSWQMSAQVSSYSFSQSSGTYTPLVGGTVVASYTSAATGIGRMDDQIYNLPAATIPFTFTYDGIGYSGLNISSNGFITFGATPPSASSYTPNSATTAYAGSIAPFGRDLEGGYVFTADRTSGSPDLVNVSNLGPTQVGDFIDGTGIPAGTTIISIVGSTITLSANATTTGILGPCRIGGAAVNIQYGVEGTAPNRVFVVQYSNFKRFGTILTAVQHMSLNFQIRFSETTNVVEVVYGNCSAGLTTLTTVNQVGLRGPNNTFSSNVNNRLNVKGTSDWATSIPGTVNSSGQVFNNVAPQNIIASGLTYSWTPPVPCAGTPTPGTVAPSALNLCSGSLPGNLVVSGFSSGVAGLAFQWEESLDGVTWANAIGGTGATTATYAPPAYAGTPIQYRAKVTCTNSSLFDFSTPTIISNATNPAVQVTNGAAINLSGVSASLNWTNGNGSRRVVVLSDNPTIVDPVNGNAPALVAAAAYAGAGQQIMYDGTAASVNVTGLANGAMYYVKIYEYVRCGSGPYDYYYNVSSGTNVFSFVSPVAPANDDCGGAIALTVGVNLAANAVVGNNGGATASQIADPTIPAPGCSSYLGGDVWYSVTVPATGNIIIETNNSTGSTITDTGIAVYSGACGALVLVECDDDDSTNGFFSLISLTGRTPGEVLYVRVFEYGNNAFGDFQVAAYDCPSATPAPTGSAAQSFCSAANPTVASLVATGTAVKWYAAATGGVALPATTALVNGTVYYASQTIDCESFNRLAVTTTVTTTPNAPTASASQTFCSAAAPTVASLVATGTAIKWYDAATAGNLLASSTALVSGNIYYGSQTVSTCESTDRVAVTATINANPAIPTGNASQTYCSTASNTIADLVVTGTNLVWYDAATLGNVLPTSTVLTSITYYVASTNGACESPRLAITTTEDCPVAGCLTAPNGQWPTATFVPNAANCDGIAIQNVTPIGWAGEYSVVTVTLGQTYVFSSSIATDIVTISADSGATVAAAGIGSVTWVSTLAGNIRFYTHLTGCGNAQVNRTRRLTCGVPSTDAPDYVNLQFPATITIAQGGSDIVYGQVYEGGLTDVAPNIVGQAPGITAWVGISPVGSNTNPNTWTTWIPATWNSGSVGNNDEYQATIGATLIPGTYYYATRFRLNLGAFVYGGIDSSNNGNFWNGTTFNSGVLTVTAPPAPANDECSGAIAVTVNTDLACGTVTPGTILGATASTVDATACFGTEDDDVWFSFVATQSTHRISLLNITGSTTDMYHSLWTGANCTSLTLVPGTCSDPNISNPTGLVAGTTYYVRVYTWTATAGQTSAFNICIGTPAPPPPAPANNDCSGAVALTPGGTFDTNPLNGTILSATTTAGITPSCQGFFGYDVWYSVVAPASGTLTIETKTATTNSMSDSVISVFTGTCGTLTQIACNDDDGDGNMSLIVLTGLTPGQTLYVAVWKWNTTAPTDTDANFRISAFDSSLSNTGFDSASFTYYPNPVKDVLNLSYSQNISQVEVYNVVGQKMTTNAYNENNVQIDMSRYPTGVYLVNVTANDVTKTVRVIKE